MKRMAKIQTKGTIPMNGGVLQRKTAISTEPAGVPPIVYDVLRYSGRPLDPAMRTFMEPRFGRDFSQVRVHTDAAAAASAREVHARAYTVGRDVVFGAGRYEPATPEGRRLIAHELTHVLQQSFGAAAPPSRGGLTIAGSQSSLEALADSVAGQVAGGGFMNADLPISGTVLQRDKEGEEKKEEETPELKKKLDAIAKNYQDIIDTGRKKGHNVAADNLERFVKGTGGVKTMEVKWLRSFEATTDAERVNQKRFEDSLTKEAKKTKHGDKKTFQDYWDREFTASKLTELYYASGTSTIRSTGTFSLEGIENIVNIGGTVKHHWFDPYDWHEGLSAFIPGFGNVSDEDALLLQKHRGAKPFQMEADWTQSLNGKIVHHDYWFDDESYSWSGP